MKNTKLKYTEAWDNKEKRWVKPEQVNKAEMHDRNRYLSEEFNDNEDKGKVLTLHRESKAFLNKNGKEVKRKSHFAAIADNTKEYREQTAKKQEHQESLVHKLSKEVLKEIKFIRVPSLSTDLMGYEFELFKGQYIKILRVVSIEKKDNTSGRIPDAVIEVEFLGKKQLINIEFFYRHAVDELKLQDYLISERNCLEIDISYLQDYLDDSEKSLKVKIKKDIQENAYWITNKFKIMIDRYVKKQYYIEINTGALLRQSYYTRERCNSDEDYLYRRAYIFKDNLLAYGINENHPCYFVPRPDSEYSKEFKCTDIGKCKNCKNCLALHNYDAESIQSIKCYCSKVDTNINPSVLITEILNKAYELI